MTNIINLIRTHKPNAFEIVLDGSTDYARVEAEVGKANLKALAQKHATTQVKIVFAIINDIASGAGAEDWI
jgi:hypothetical protein